MYPSDRAISRRVLKVCLRLCVTDGRQALEGRSSSSTATGDRAVWEPLAPRSSPGHARRCVSPPGFGAPLPGGFDVTPEGYRAWLAAELERFEEPVDLVGHDWGGIHVVNLAMTRPELIRSWATDAIKAFHPDYVWHQLARHLAEAGCGRGVDRAAARRRLPGRAADRARHGAGGRQGGRRELRRDHGRVHPAPLPRRGATGDGAAGDEARGGRGATRAGVPARARRRRRHRARSNARPRPAPGRTWSSCRAAGTGG